MDNQDEPRVLVVGAGLAGIGAATRLHELGFTDVSLLEGSDRLGGRTWSREFGLGIIELGAAWIHGPSPGNAVFRVASAHGLLEDGDERAAHQAALEKAHGKGVRRLAYWTNLGRTIDVEQEAASSYYEELIDNIQKMFSSDQDFRSEHAGLGVGQYIKQQVAKHVADEWSKDDEELLRIKLGTISMRFKEEASISGANSLDQVDLVSFGEYVALPGEDCVFLRGYSSLVDLLLKRFPRERVLLNKHVQCINWDGMECKDGQSQVRVTCKGGECFFADHVIITVPLGYLKNHHSTMFEPSLPMPKVKALENLGFGTVNKIFLEFSEPFWKAGLEYVRLVWEDESPLKVRPQQFPPEWERKIQGLQVLQPPERYGHVICLWISGKESEYVEDLPDEEVQQRLMKFLRMFTGNAHISEPLQMLRTRWHSNPHVLGSYSYVKVGSSGNDISELASPLPQPPFQEKRLKPQLLFAGEATHRYFYSTAHGALNSGWREAQRLALLYGREQDLEEWSAIST